MPSIGVIASDLVNLQLINSGYVMLHGATLASGDQAILISGLPDTGKTYSATRLIQQGYSYMGDDISVLHERGDVFAVPYTLTSNQQIPLKSRILNKFCKYDNYRMNPYSHFRPSLRYPRHKP